jgi:hypothetical protein
MGLDARSLSSTALSFTVFLALLGAASAARAEGSAGAGSELDDSQALRGSTDIHVDILDMTTETFVWTGKGGVDVFDPAGTRVGMFMSGAVITPAMNGAYRLDLLEDQYDTDAAGDIIRSTVRPWDVTVSAGAVERPGRAWSFEWAFNTGGFDRAAGTNASFYAKVPGGDAESFAVMELRTDGLAGFIFEIQGNSTGVRGENAGRSVPEVGNSAANEYAIYLNPPENASYTYLEPSVRDFRFHGGVETPGGVETCDEFVPGVTMGEFVFTSNVEGSYHLVCDLNRDGVFDIVDDGDFLILGHATVGENRVPFDGLDNAGMPFTPGDHECRVRVTVGEFHYVGRDIETSFLGLRMFQVRRDASRSPLPMYWNDALVQSREVTMPAPYAFISAETSGPMGLDSGDPAAPTVPLGQTVRPAGANSRAWGDFVSVGGAGSGKGNEAYLDTYTWLDEELSAPITIHAVDGTLDSDGEGLTDYIERCTTGTDPMNPDTDGDSVNDSVETRMGMPGVDTDLDDDVDARDTDDDDDCVLTRVEDPDGDGDPTNDDTDMDGTPNYLDEEDDGDAIDTCMEDPNEDGDPTNDDADGDGIPNYLEIDSDGDCDLRPMEPSIMCNDTDDVCPYEREVVNGFQDMDGCPEPDRDGDGRPDEDDNCPDIPNPMQQDLDGDGRGDVCDDDIDGDGLANGCESPAGACPGECRTICADGVPGCTGCGETDPMDADSDNGGVPDGREVMRGSDPGNPIDDPLPGVITGSGAFQCAAAPGSRGLPWQVWVIAVACGIALVARRRVR